MATALRSSCEKTNGAKLSRLIVDGGRSAVQNVFEAIHPPNTLQVIFNTHYTTLQRLLKKRKVLNDKQWDLLFPPGGELPDPNSFDITLLFVLLRNICGLHPPATGWDKKPPATDKSREANLARIKWFRNEVAHATTTAIDDSLFSQYWVELSDTLVQLGLDQSEIDRLKSAPLDEDQYIGLLSKWKREDDDIKEQLEILNQKVDAVLSKVFDVFFMLKR